MWLTRSSRVSVLERVVVDDVVDEHVGVIDIHFAVLVIQGPHVRRSA